MVDADTARQEALLLLRRRSNRGLPFQHASVVLVMPGALIQMAGHAGSGKSTLARSMAASLGGVVVDLDTVKSALLEGGVGWAEASSGSYQVIYGLVHDMLLTSTTAVIVDTPSYWREIHQRLTATADALGAQYRFVECVADDDVRAARLAQRTTRRSQIRDLGVNALDAPLSADVMHVRPIQRPGNRTCIKITTNAEVDADDVVSALALLP